MKGLQEALRDREERHLRTEKLCIDEDAAGDINAALSRLRPGMKISVSCYRAFHNTVSSGTVSVINTTYKYLKLREEKIFFDDIYSLEIRDE